MLNKDGTTRGVDDGPEFNVVCENVLGDLAWATPAIVRGNLFVRTYSGLLRFQDVGGQGVEVKSP